MNTGTKCQHMRQLAVLQSLFGKPEKLCLHAKNMHKKVRKMRANACQKYVTQLLESEISPDVPNQIKPKFEGVKLSMYCQVLSTFC